MKRSMADGPGGEPMAQRQREGPPPCAFKILIPQIMCGPVMGRSGSNITQIRESTGVKIQLSAKGVHFPGTTCQVLYLGAQEPDQIAEAIRQIVARMPESLEAGGEVQEITGKTEGDFKFRCILPKAAVGSVLGRGGEHIKEMKERTGTRVSIDQNTIGHGAIAEQVVTLLGPVENIEAAALECLGRVMEHAGDPFFPEWSASNARGGNLPDGKGGGKFAGAGGKGDFGVDPYGKGAWGPGGGDPYGKGAWGPGGGDPYGKGDYGGYGKGIGKGIGKGTEYAGKGAYGGKDAYGGKPAQIAIGGMIGKGMKGKGEQYAAQPPVRHAASADPEYDILMSTADNLPQQVKSDPRGFAMSCIVPDSLVGALIGKGGSGTKEAQAKTGTKISIAEIEGDPENKSLKISGPLMCICAGYMEMMSRYISAEARAARPMKGGGKGAPQEMMVNGYEEQFDYSNGGFEGQI